MKHFELTPDESYGRNMEQALQKIQAEAERNGVPPGLQPELHMDENLATTFRWEWEEDEDGPTPPPLHAHEITKYDAALIRMMAGAQFGPTSTVTLPSGKTITGDEMRRWIEGQDS